MKIVGWILLVLVGVALAVSGYIAKGRYESLVGERDRLASKTSELEASLARAKSDNEQTLKRENLAQQEMAELKKQREEAEHRLEQVKELTAKFQELTASGKLKIVVRHGRMIVKMPAEVLFDTGKADLSTDGKKTVAQVAAILRTEKNSKLMVAGHTDSVPIVSANYHSNWELSAARAVTVTEFLVKAGIRPTNLFAAGFAEHDPVATNASADGRKENRRIELVLEPAILEALPGLVDDVSEAAATAAAPGSAQPASSAPSIPAPAASAH